MSFGQTKTPFALGVEEELFVVDAESLETVPLFDRLVPDPGPQLKPELFECLVETATPICRDAEEALGELESLREEVGRRATRNDATVIAAGAHPRAVGEEQTIVPLPRYERLRKELGDRIYMQLVCGLHVHVSMPDTATCLRAFEGVVPWLPVLLALSANSPFMEGKRTGLRSARAARLLLMPTGGTPPLLPDWAAWEDATQGDESRRHWDAWPRAVHGTLEIRVTDQQTDIRRSAGFAAVAQALAATVADREAVPYDRALYARRREEASREPPASGDVAALTQLIEPAARALGGWELAEPVLGQAAEADRQLEIADAEGLDGVARDLAERSLPSAL